MMLDHERYVRNKEERKERQREYYRTHREEILARVRLRRLGLYEREESDEDAARERKRERDREYYRKNRERKLAYLREYRQRVRNAMIC